MLDTRPIRMHHAGIVCAEQLPQRLLRATWIDPQAGRCRTDRDPYPAALLLLAPAGLVNPDVRMRLQHRLDCGIARLERVAEARATGDYTAKAQVNASDLVQECDRFARTQAIPTME